MQPPNRQPKQSQHSESTTNPSGKNETGGAPPLLAAGLSLQLKLQLAIVGWLHRPRVEVVSLAPADKLHEVQDLRPGQRRESHKQGP